MYRPAVELANHTEVYEYYGSQEINQLVARGLHRAAALLYHPQVTYGPEAESTIERHLDEGGRFILASNHINMFDQLPLAAAMSESRVLQPMVGNTKVWAKQAYFTNPLLRPWLDAVGGIPVWREGRELPTSTSRQTRLAMVNELFEATAQCIANGAHLHVDPEGTRNKGDLTKLGKIQSGVGRVAVLAAERIQDTEQHNWAKVMVMPTALWYGDDTPKGSLRPTLYIHKPFTVTPRTMPRVVTERLTTAMTDSLGHARAHSARDSLRQ